MTFHIHGSKYRAWDPADGSPLAGGKVYTYEKGTTTAKTTWADQDKAAANTNPVILDSNGEATIYLDGDYKIVLKDSADATVYTVDGISSALDADAVQALIDASIGTTTPVYATVSALAAATVAEGVERVRVQGYTSVYDAGGAEYIRVSAAPSHDLRVRSTDRYLAGGGTDAANGGWWEIATEGYSPLVAGAVGDAVTNDTAAIDDVNDAAAPSKLIDLLGRTYEYVGTFSVTSGKTFVNGSIADDATTHVFNASTVRETLSPAQITADQNDYSPTGLSTAGWLRIDTDAARTLTGLAGGWPGRRIIVSNIGSFALTLAHESASSTAGNRFSLPGSADLSIPAGATAVLIYDGVSSRWRRAEGAVATTAFIEPIVKTADETVNNSTTLQDDDELVFAMEASKTYLVEVRLLLSAASTTPDFKFGWSYPTGCTIYWTLNSRPGWGEASTGGALLLVEVGTFAAASQAGTNGAIFTAIVRNSTTAGNLQLQWAQNTADASDSKVLKHSSMIVTELGAT